MKRVRSFDTPHKGLRNLLSRFSFLAGTIDYADPVQLVKLKNAGAELFEMMEEHAKIENEILLPELEKRCPGASAHDLHDHEVIEKQQEKLATQLTAMTTAVTAEEAHLFYLSFSRFHGMYLEHIYSEETTTEALLWENFTDEELLEIRGRIMRHFTPQTLLFSMKCILPAQNNHERMQMLAGIKANAPAPVFDAILDVIRPEMGDEAVNAIRKALEAKTVSNPA